jgi:uncharacterized oligopeptide transporter (OPT) family protein
MKLVIDGVLQQSLPWVFVAIGVGIALLAEAFRIPSLPFAVGVYLPVSTMVPVFLGGLLRWLLTRKASAAGVESRREAGVLLGSGFVGGEGLMGVGIALAAGWAVARGGSPWFIGHGFLGTAAPWVATLCFAALIGLFVRRCWSAQGPGR